MLFNIFEAAQRLISNINIVDNYVSSFTHAIRLFASCDYVFVADDETTPGMQMQNKPSICFICCQSLMLQCSPQLNCTC